jgi:hypothetical protein
MTSKRPATKSKRPGPPKGQGGRPPKAPADIATTSVTTRWTGADKALLDALVESEREAARAAGLAAADRVTVSDVLRLLVRAEGKRRGLLQVDVVA